MLSDSKVIKRFETDIKTAKSGLSAQWDNTRVCQEFYAGNSMVWQDRLQYTTRRGEKRRALIQFNKVMPFVDTVAGFMAQNRRVAKYNARVTFQPKQEFYTHYANATSNYIRSHAHADAVESEQDLDMLICGYGAVTTDISYIVGQSTTCPNGEVIVERLDPRNTFWDPRARRKNMMDRRYCGYWIDYYVEDALGLFPGSTEKEFGLIDSNEDEDKEYYYDPYGGRYDKVAFDERLEWADKAKKMVRVYNYQWFQYEKYYQATNPAFKFKNPVAQMEAMRQLQALADEQEEEYKSMFTFDPQAKTLTFDAKLKTKLVEIFGEYINPVEFVRKRFYTAVISGKTVFNSWSSIHQQDFSVQFKSGTFDDNRRIYIGMVNNMMEPQLYYNKALTELMFTIASNSKGGVLVEKGTIEDIQDFEAKYASTTAVIEVRENALAEKRIQPKAQVVPTTGLDGIITLTDAAISDAAGVDKAFLGARDDANETAVGYKRRIRQIISTLAKYFDSITLYQQFKARLDLDYMRVWAENNEGALVELMGENGNIEMMQVTSDPFMAEYGITVQEAPQTPEDKQDEAELISTLGDKVIQVNPQGALKIYAVAVKSLNIDAQAKQELIEALTGQQIDPAEVEQLRQQVQLLSSDTNKADVNKKNTDAQLNLAKIEEIRAKIAEGPEGPEDKTAENLLRAEELRLQGESNSLEAERIDLDRAKIIADVKMKHAEIGSKVAVAKISAQSKSQQAAKKKQASK